MSSEKNPTSQPEEGPRFLTFRELEIGDMFIAVSGLENGLGFRDDHVMFIKLRGNDSSDGPAPASDHPPGAARNNNGDPSFFADDVRVLRLV